MALFILKLFILLGFAASLTRSLPMRQFQHHRPTIIQKSGEDAYEVEADTRQCIPIRDGNVPTDIIIKGDSSVSYKLLGYSSKEKCRNGYLVLKNNLSPYKQIEINQRRKICSFWLREPVNQNLPVTVKFTYGHTSVEPLHFRFGRQDCANLCQNNYSSMYAYPQNVEVLVNNQPASNLLILYSNTKCEPNSELRDLNNVGHGYPLVSNTRIYPNEIVNFIMIKEIKQVEEEESSEYK